MKLSKVTSGGKVTIPASLRKKYELKSGTRVKLEATKNGIKIIPLATPEEIKTNSGFLGTKGKLLKSLMIEKEREREL